MIRKLLFRLQAKTRHGTHSPFIYAFLEDTLYARKRKGLSDELRLLQATVEHFKPRNIGASTESGLSRWLKERHPGLRWEGPPFDLILFEKPRADLLEFAAQKELWHDKSIVFVSGIREGDLNRGFWKRACALPEYRIQLETYASGLLFFRPEQAREHFKIRI